MHAAIYRARMTEDTFQLLLDVMERHFAALSLPDPATDPKITRAISFSEFPSTRRILIEQSYQTDDSGGLVRQYSCEQIFNKLSNSREVKVSEVVRTGSERCLTNTWRTTLPVFGELGNAGWHKGHFGQMIGSIEPRNSRKMELMEVEEIDVKPFKQKSVRKSPRKLPIFELNGMTLSDVNSGDRMLVKASTFGTLEAGAASGFTKPAVRSRSVSPKKFANRSIIAESKLMEIPKTEDTENVAKIDYETTKKKLRSLVPEEATNPRKSRFSCTCYKFIFFILLSFSAAIIAIFLQEADFTRRKVDSLDFANMSVELRSRIYGQERAIKELIRELQKSSNGINLVALIGGTGVGKSYAVAIVAKYFSPSNDIFEYFSPLRKIIHEALGALSRRHCNLVILENLQKDDLRDVTMFVKFMKEETKQLCVNTIAIFNPQETGNDLSRKLDIERSVDEISLAFREKELHEAKIVVFNALDDKNIEACVLQAAKQKSVELSQEQLTEIRDNLIIAGSGCKGAYAKVQMVIET